jgi:probable selenium-dependent hydroxylase accessory protein YqeC
MRLIDALYLAGEPGTPDIIAIAGGGGKSSALFQLRRELTGAGKRVILTTSARMGMYQIEDEPARLQLDDPVAQLPLERMHELLAAHGHCLLTGPTVHAVAGDERSRKAAGISPVQWAALLAATAALGVSAIVVEADGSRKLPAKAPGPHEPALPVEATYVLYVMGADAVGQLVDDQHLHRSDRMRAVLGLAATGEFRLTPAAAARLLRHEAGGRKAIPPRAAWYAVVNKTDLPTRLPVARLMAESLVRAGERVLLTALQNELDPVQERMAPILAVVLAAGSASRMGRPKQILPVAGVAMVIRAVRTALQSGVAGVLLVTGAHRDAVMATLDELAPAERACIHEVFNPAWQTGQASSVRAAVNAADTVAPNAGAVAAVIALASGDPGMGAREPGRRAGGQRPAARGAGPLCSQPVAGFAGFDRG